MIILKIFLFTHILIKVYFFKKTVCLFCFDGGAERSGDNLPLGVFSYGQKPNIKLRKLRKNGKKMVKKCEKMRK